MIFFYDKNFNLFVIYFMWDIDSSYFKYIIVYCDNFFNFIREYIKVRYDNYVFFMINNVEEVFIIVSCNIIGCKLIVF